MKLELTINGQPKTMDVSGDALLLDVLRDAGYFEVKQGCREGACGACTVLIDGRPVNSCVTLAGLAHGKKVETVKAIGTIDAPHALQRALVEVGAVQCGFCMPGTILAAKALLEDDPDPTDERIAKALDGNLCRCTGYVKTIEGVRRAADEMRRQSES